MRLMSVKYDDNEFLNNLHTKFNKKSDLLQFKKDNPLIDLLIINLNSEPVFLTRNNATIKVTIVKLNDHRYFSIKHQ